MTELFKKYRPQDFDRMLGSEETVESLVNMIARKRVPHSLLFVGASGTGKTTLARIVATKLGCLEADLREVNSSSYRGIDSIRDIAQKMTLAPTGPCRVWIMDEAHKLSNDAQNAALKMLEDTPAHVYFMLCTTDPERLIKAIRTRCCEMPLRLLKDKELEKLLGYVCKKEGITLTDDHRDEMILASQGSARMLLVLLDKIANVDQAKRSEAIASRVAEANQAIELCRALIQKAPWKRVAAIIKGLEQDPEGIRWAVLGYAKAVLLGQAKPDPQAYFVIQAFSSPFYDSKEAGLVAACYEALHGE